MALPMKKDKADQPKGPVTTDQAQAAMKAFAQKNKKMSKKSRKRVAKRLKGMLGGK